MYEDTTHIPGETAIEARGLGKRYGELWALRDLHLEGFHGASQFLRPVLNAPVQLIVGLTELLLLFALVRATVKMRAAIPRSAAPQCRDPHWVCRI